MSLAASTRAITRAILSVSDKTELVPLAVFLCTQGVELISTGGTARDMRKAGLPVIEVADYTGFPEMLDGRVKTLHPKVHGGLLAVRENAEHMAALRAHEIKPVDLLVVNLYPFAATIKKPGVTLEDAIENIDIGGPAMIRSAAKNHASVTVLTDPSQYKKLIEDLERNGGATSLAFRQRLMVEAFFRTANYDRMIAEYFNEKFGVLHPAMDT